MHLEMPYNHAPRHNKPFVYEYLGEDVIVLAGDIHTQNFHDEFLQQLPTDVKIIMIAGNHEAYGQSFDSVHTAMKDLETRFANFKYLNNEGYTIGDVEFFGGTMFTSLTGEHCERDCPRFIPDFSVVHQNGKTRTTQDHKNDHDKFCKELVLWKSITEGAKKRVVISHFVPTWKALDPKFANSSLNGYFIEDMEMYMAGIDVWMFGHTHGSHNFMIEDTRLVCNPFGYNQENIDGFDTNKVIEV